MAKQRSEEAIVLDSPGGSGADVLASLRAQVEQLQTELQQARQLQTEPLNLSTTPAPGVYLVRLPLMRPRLPSVTIEPRQKAEKPQKTYEGISLFQRGRNLDLVAAAWNRYCEEHQVAFQDRKQFRVIPNPGPSVEALEVEALTQADAWEIFQRFNGITSTVQRPKIEKVS